MATLLFRLRNVPDDEADEIRQLLTEKQVNFYETDAGSWGISMPAFWLHDEADLATAKPLIDGYQQQRQQHMRETYNERKAAGSVPSLMDRVKKQPLKILAIVAFCLFILFVMINPIMSMLQYQPQ